MEAFKLIINDDTLQYHSENLCKSGDHRKKIEDNIRIFFADNIDPPESFINYVINKIIDYKSNRFCPSEASRKLIANYILNHINFPLICEEVLADLNLQEDDQRMELFKNYFKVLLINSLCTYIFDFLNYNNLKIKNVSINKVKIDDFNNKNDYNYKAVIDSILIKPNEQPVNISFYLILDKTGWKLTKYVIDTVDHLDTYKIQFKKIVLTKGFNALLNKLKLQYVSERDRVCLDCDNIGNK